MAEIEIPARDCDLLSERGVLPRPVHPCRASPSAKIIDQRRASQHYQATETRRLLRRAPWQRAGGQVISLGPVDFNRSALRISIRSPYDWVEIVDEWSLALIGNAPAQKVGRAVEPGAGAFSIRRQEGSRWWLRRTRSMAIEGHSGTAMPRPERPVTSGCPGRAVGSGWRPCIRCGLNRAARCSETRQNTPRRWRAGGTSRGEFVGAPS